LPSPFLEVRGTWELEANTLQEAALGAEGDSFVFPVVPKYRSTITFSLQEFGSEIAVFVELESS